MSRPQLSANWPDSSRRSCDAPSTSISRLGSGVTVNSWVVSGQYWELLTRVATGPTAEVTWWCRELVRQSEVERLFCVVRRNDAVAVTAVDCDGYPLGYADQRLRDSEFGSLALGAPGGAKLRVRVTRQVSAASKRTAVIGSLVLQPNWVVTLVLENRFSGELATLDDQAVERWVVLVALAVRFEALSQYGKVPTLGVNPSSVLEHPRETSRASEARLAGRRSATWQNGDASAVVDLSLSPAHAAERRETLRALDAEQWNISRAARTLGMTRHGLKKRMRRLQVARPN